MGGADGEVAGDGEAVWQWVTMACGLTMDSMITVVTNVTGVVVTMDTFIIAPPPSLSSSPPPLPPLLLLLQLQLHIRIV